MLTTGEMRTLSLHNENLDETMQHIRVLTSELIDLCDKIECTSNKNLKEFQRLQENARTSFELGLMWASKADSL